MSHGLLILLQVRSWEKRQTHLLVRTPELCTAIGLPEDTAGSRLPQVTVVGPEVKPTEMKVCWH